MLKRQEEILIEVAKRHGIPIGKAKHIFSCVCATIVEKINNAPRDETGAYIYEEADCISLVNFGKFIPSKRKIENRNKYLKMKNECKSEQ